MRIGYARVSTDEQSLDLQLDALKKARCKHVFSDKASATKDERPGLADALSHLHCGDVPVVFPVKMVSEKTWALWGQRCQTKAFRFSETIFEIDFSPYEYDRSRERLALEDRWFLLRCYRNPITSRWPSGRLGARHLGTFLRHRSALTS